MNLTFRLLKPIDFTQKVTAEVLDLGMRSGTWQDSAGVYYVEQFLNPRNINIVAQDESCVIIGYILAKPHNEAVVDYSEIEDPAMKESETPMSYVDIVIVDTGHAGSSIGMRLVYEMIRESNQRGVFRFSLHCRTVNGFSKIIQCKFREGLQLIRRIDHYIDCNNEPFDYMEIVVDLNKAI